MPKSVDESLLLLQRLGYSCGRLVRALRSPFTLVTCTFLTARSLTVEHAVQAVGNRNAEISLRRSPFTNCRTLAPTSTLVEAELPGKPRSFSVEVADWKAWQLRFNAHADSLSPDVRRTTGTAVEAATDAEVLNVHLRSADAARNTRPFYDLVPSCRATHGNHPATQGELTSGA